MIPADYHDFFAASSSVAGALIGLLFVALSVIGGRDERAHGEQLRASAAFTAFSNSLAVSLFALVPGDNVAWPALSLSIVGLAFVVASLISVVRVRRRGGRGLEALFLVGLGVIFGFQLAFALTLTSTPHDVGAVNTIATLVVVCFVVGIARAWELMGGPQFGIAHEFVQLVRDIRGIEAEPAAAEEDEPVQS